MAATTSAEASLAEKLSPALAQACLSGSCCSFRFLVTFAGSALLCPSRGDMTKHLRPYIDRQPFQEYVRRPAPRIKAEMGSMRAKTAASQWIDISAWQNLMPQRTNRSGYRFRMAA